MVDPSFAAPHLRTEAQIERKELNNQPVMRLAENPSTRAVSGKPRKRVQSNLVSRLIRGRFWETGHLLSEQKEGQTNNWAEKLPWLERTLGSLRMNGSYTQQDVEDFKARVLKFIPGPAAGAKAASKQAPTKTA
jgi:hypothetical protein